MSNQVPLRALLYMAMTPFCIRATSSTACTVSGKAGHYGLVIDGVRVHAWPHQYRRIRKGDTVQVEYLAEDTRDVLIRSVLTINRRDNPYFENAVFMGPA